MAAAGLAASCAQTHEASVEVTQAPDTVCAAPDARPTVVLLDRDTGVPNGTLPGGCTLNDVIDDERSWRDRGSFVAHVEDVVDGLVASGQVDPRDRARLTAAAASSQVGTVPGYEVLFDGTAASLADWAYAGVGGFDLIADGSLVSRTGPRGGFGTLWYTPREFGDFSLRLRFRDDAPGEARANSGVQVRFPALRSPVEGCPAVVGDGTGDGDGTGNLAWVAVACGHEVQINDSPETGSDDPRKTGSVYGFADLSLAEAMPTPKNTWNDLEVRVVGQHYTVIRNGEVINRYENVPGVPFPGRPDDPGSDGRGLVGHVGLQAHGGPADVVSFRDIRVRALR